MDTNYSFDGVKPGKTWGIAVEYVNLAEIPANVIHRVASPMMSRDRARVQERTETYIYSFSFECTVVSSHRLRKSRAMC